MDFGLTQEQRDIQRMCREFAEKEIEPYVREHLDVEWEGTPEERFPAEVYEVADEVGLRVIGVPSEYGGDDWHPDVVTEVLMVEELAAGDHGIASAMHVNWKLCNLLRQYPEHLQAEWFPRIVEDPTFMMTHCLTEPKGASDRWLPYNEPDGNMNTVAEKDGDEWVIDGTKQFVTNSYEANLYFVYANTDPSKGMLDGTSGPFLVPGDTPGVTVARENQTIGHRFNSNSEFHFDDVRVPEDHLLIRDTALRDVGQYFRGGRVKVAAGILGTARAASEAGLEYAQDRVQGGKPIVEHQMIQRRIAEMATQLETARTIVWRAAEAADAGRDDANELAIIAKLFAADACMEIAQHCVEIHGGAGSMRPQGVERLMRDAVTNLHLHGTQDVHQIKLVNAIVGEGDPGTHA